MPRRFLSIYFPFLATDYALKQHPEYKGKPVVLKAAERGRIVVRKANEQALQEGIACGKTLADARALCAEVMVLDYDAEQLSQVLSELAEACLRFAPVVAPDAPDGINLDCSGCAHLWGGEEPYAQAIVNYFAAMGFQLRLAMADTVGAAWAVAHYASQPLQIVPEGAQAQALAHLPPAALRILPDTVHRMQQLGFKQIAQFMTIPAPVLKRRLGPMLLCRLGQALGVEPECLLPIKVLSPYCEQLSCLEPVLTVGGIDIALRHLVERLCQRLSNERKGARSLQLRAYRTDGSRQEVQIGTNNPSADRQHLYQLLVLKRSGLRPEAGFEAFELEALLVEDMGDTQETLWGQKSRQEDVGSLLDSIAAKMGRDCIKCYRPVERHWPERALAVQSQWKAQQALSWPASIRPLHLLARPEPIQVMVPLPDYPPILFVHKGKVYKVLRADGPERIEPEWWHCSEPARDYYRAEDDKGARYWLFRQGHYSEPETVRWFLHGYFA